MHYYLINYDVLDQSNETEAGSINRFQTNNEGKAKIVYYKLGKSVLVNHALLNGKNVFIVNNIDDTPTIRAICDNVTSYSIVKSGSDITLMLQNRLAQTSIEQPRGYRVVEGDLLEEEAPVSTLAMLGNKLGSLFSGFSSSSSNAASRHEAASSSTAVLGSDDVEEYNDEEAEKAKSAQKWSLSSLWSRQNPETLTPVEIAFAEGNYPQMAGLLCESGSASAYSQSTAEKLKKLSAGEKDKLAAGFIQNALNALTATATTAAEDSISAPRNTPPEPGTRAFYQALLQQLSHYGYLTRLFAVLASSDSDNDSEDTAAKRADQPIVDRQRAVEFVCECWVAEPRAQLTATSAGAKSAAFILEQRQALYQIILGKLKNYGDGKLFGKTQAEVEKEIEALRQLDGDLAELSDSLTHVQQLQTILDGMDGDALTKHGRQSWMGKLTKSKGRAFCDNLIAAATAAGFEPMKAPEKTATTVEEPFIGRTFTFQSRNSDSE